MEQELEKVENFEETTQQVDESKFMSADNPDVIKVDLDNQPSIQKEEIKKSFVDGATVQVLSQRFECTKYHLMYKICFV